MTGILPAALTPADLPPAELNAAGLDGEVFALGGSWCPVDTAEGPEARAAAAARLAPSRAVAERMSAAWIYGLADLPAQHQFCIDVGARTRKPCGRLVHLREVRLPTADTVLIGGLSVTSPLRTAVDLARWGESPGRGADTALIAALLHRAGCDGTESAEAVLPAATRTVSFSRIAAAALNAALRRLSAVADPVDVIDGVDPAHGVEHSVEVGGVAHLEHEPADRQSVA
jgi:hypothetical protein